MLLLMERNVESAEIAELFVIIDDIVF